MTAYRAIPHRRVPAAILWAAVFGLSGCSSGPAGGGEDRAFDGIRAAEREIAGLPERARDPSRPAAYVNGEPITWEEVRGPLSEAAGGAVLRDLILDRLLERELSVRGLTVTDEAVESEKRHLAVTLARETLASPDQIEQLVAAMRHGRNLGEIRFEQLLRRSAGLRALVASDVSVTDDEVRAAYEVRHGMRYRCRVILVETEHEAERVRSELVAATEHLDVRFAEAAAVYSRDPSASRGGLSEPMSPSDGAYPTAVRAALGRLKPGEVSPVIVADGRFALLLLVEKMAADGVPFESAEADVREAVRRRNERVAMDDAALRLLRVARVVIPDRALDWSWRNLGAPE